MPTSPPRLQPILHATSHPLHSAQTTRAIEQALAATLPAHTLMQRAGLAVARLACALAPHAQTIWVACGPGNNGGDGFEAAMHLQRWGHRPVVTFCGDEARLPADAQAALAGARRAGVVLADAPPAQCDIAIDALLGIGSARPLGPPMGDWLLHMQRNAAVVLCVDLPSGLDADTGCYPDAQFAANIASLMIANYAMNTPANRRFCLSLLTLKPGLFTAQGKDAAGQVWWDDLGASAPAQGASPAGAAAAVLQPPSAWLTGADRLPPPGRLHNSHKGSYGDVAVIGGAPGMTGAALLAASAALHGGAGRVLVALLDNAGLAVDLCQPELMLRAVGSLDLQSLTVVCGCGGADAVRGVLARVLSQSARLVLDADALNAIATDTALQTLLAARAARGRPTVLTPHPLEAARLLATSAAAVQANRLQAAQQLADRYQSTVVLKGAGSIVAAPGQLPCVNASGNAQLASAGTGDVLAGLLGALWAQGLDATAAASSAVFMHGHVADGWLQHAGPTARSGPGRLTASALAQQLPGAPG